MPTIKNIPGPYRFFFFSFDCDEPPPPHVHVRRERAVCKYWLDPISLASNFGFASRDLAAISRVIFEQPSKMLEAWREHCSGYNWRR